MAGNCVTCSKSNQLVCVDIKDSDSAHEQCTGTSDSLRVAKGCINFPWLLALQRKVLSECVAASLMSLSWCGKLPESGHKRPMTVSLRN